MRGQDNQYEYISTATTTQVVTGQGTLNSIIVGTTAAGTIKVIDSVLGVTTNLAELETSVVEGTYEFNLRFNTGLKIITGSTSKITVVYST